MHQKIHLFGPRDLLLKINRDLFTIEYHCVPAFEWEQLSTFEIMVLILEDRRFCQHIGVDWKSCAREIIKAVTLRKHGGASTIDMQFVRTATGYRDVTIRRKLYEIFLSTLIQTKYSKLEILRSYLNSAFFGSHLIGANIASQTLFRKNPADLEPDEAAVLASMLVYPRPLVPVDSWSRKIERRAKYARLLYPLLKERFEQFPIGKNF